MSRYLSQSFGSPYPLNKGASSSSKIALASAQQPPALGRPEEVKKTAEIVVENYDGGMGFSLTESFRQALRDKHLAEANKHLETLLLRLAVFGTCDMRVDVNVTKLTVEMRGLFYEFARHNLGLVVQCLRDVYEQNRAPKVVHVVYLLALLTSATAEDAGSAEAMVEFRSKGYGIVTMFRMTTHLFEWINTHISLCSLSAKGLEDKEIEKAPGLVVSQKSKFNGKGKGGSARASSSSKAPKLARAGGTGAGFRKAVEAWYLARCADVKDAMSLCIQVVKYANRVGYTHKDVLSLIHIKMTTRTKCKCNVKNQCKCPVPLAHELKNLIPVAGQITLGYAVYGLEHAAKILCDGVQRLEYNQGDPEKDPDITQALNVFAFLCAVEKAKAEQTTADDVSVYIRLFRLTREMVSNTKLSDVGVGWDLLVKSRPDPRELGATQRTLLLEKLPLHTLINSLFTDKQDQAKDEQKDDEPQRLQIGMPATALVRNLNKLDNLVDRATNPRAQELVMALTQHLTNPDVLRRGLLHPINLFNAWAVYSRGRGHLGSMTWTPVEAINKALLDATEMAFKGLKGYDMSMFFLMDASGSMSSEGSAPGMPCLKALDIAVLLLLTMYRPCAMRASESGKSPNHMIGYFGGSGSGNTNRAVNKMITSKELASRTEPFKDVTHMFTPTTTFQEAKEALGNGGHLGMTDVGSGLWFLIEKLINSLNQVKAGNKLFKGMTMFQLTGFAQLIFLFTDNDCNSGDQPMDVLNLYWGLVRQGFQLLPFDKNGKKDDPEVLFNKYIPRMVIVATQGGPMTVGDPRDHRILNVSGFDSSSPALIDAFVNNGQGDALVPVEDEE
jgi:hypothetical protein